MVFETRARELINEMLEDSHLGFMEQAIVRLYLANVDYLIFSTWKNIGDHNMFGTATAMCNLRKFMSEDLAHREDDFTDCAWRYEHARITEGELI